MCVAEEPKRTYIGTRIEAIRSEVADLERQQAPLDNVIAIHMPGYTAEAPRGRRPAPRGRPRDGDIRLSQRNQIRERRE